MFGKSRRQPKPRHQDASLASIAEQIEAQREKASEFLAAHEERIQRIESRLSDELAGIVGQLDQWQSCQQQLAERRVQIGQEVQQLERDRLELEARASHLDQQAKETEAQRRRIAQKLDARRGDLRSARDRSVAQLTARVDQLRQELEEERDRADDNSRRCEMLEGQCKDHEARSARFESESREARNQLVAARSEEAVLRQQQAHSRKLLNERAEQLKQLREQLDELTHRQDRLVEETRAVDPVELVQLRRERDQLQDEVNELKSRLVAVEEQRGDTQQVDDLRRQFEMAVEEVRRLQGRVEELQAPHHGQQGRPPGSEPSGSWDWETQKRWLMAQMDRDEHATESAKGQAIETTVRVTDEIVAQKDRQIAELQARCEELMATAAAGPAELAPQAAFDSDELIVQERDRLQKLQEEWREKVRAAEVELAVERARSARIRTELDEKMRDLQAQLALARKQSECAGNNKSTARRWLSKLGRGN
jgi:chromosome segregation protein